tara:strand:- start:203 stop:424 length:222 start_codon:yes stop_codon:yes gene_type:complete
MGNTCIKNFYKKMPISEKCCICKKQRFIGGDETAFRISMYGCRVCRLKKKYFSADTNDEVSITRYQLNKGRYK